MVEENHLVLYSRSDGAFGCFWSDEERPFLFFFFFFSIISACKSPPPSLSRPNQRRAGRMRKTEDGNLRLGIERECKTIHTNTHAACMMNKQYCLPLPLYLTRDMANDMSYVVAAAASAASTSGNGL
ncbi:hypothetical protein LY78DRAFT_482605 [Colletotrichum sublineola]|nr:hypothetical protein LY78DRAFT_482605 [Colletotrichum sublineola]